MISNQYQLVFRKWSIQPFVSQSMNGFLGICAMWPQVGLQFMHEPCPDFQIVLYFPPKCISPSPRIVYPGTPVICYFWLSFAFRNSRIMEHSNWQTDLSSLKERAKYALNNSLFCDVEFLVADSDGNKVIVSANKFVLAITSPVFAAMFYGQLAESKSPIELPDCTKEGLQELLRFAYSDEVNLSAVNIMEVIYLADKYMITSLADQCKKYIGSKVRPQNVLMYLQELPKVGKAYEELCWEVIDKETQQALESSSFLEIPKELLCEILVRDNLRVKELVLFKAIDRWASKRIENQELSNDGETKREVLGEEVIKLIRFPLMSEREFAEVVLPAKILKLDEVTEVIRTLNQLPVTGNVFSGEDRQAKHRLMMTSNRFANISEEQVINFKYKTIIGFNVNKSVKLHGFRMFGTVDCVYSVKYIVKRLDTVKQLHRTLEELAIESIEVEEGKIDNLYHGFTINLPQAITLDSNELYLIIVDVKDSKEQSNPLTFGCNSSSTLTCEDIRVDVTRRLTRIGNSSSRRAVIGGGQIQSLIFSE